MSDTTSNTKSWYVVKAMANQEKKAREAILEAIDKSNLKDAFGEVLVPTEEVYQMKDGKRTKSERRFFPGYVLVEMDFNEFTYNFIIDNKKTRGFVGGNKPAPLTAKEIGDIKSRMERGESSPKPKTLFEVGEAVRVIDGPFNDFTASVVEIQYEKSRLKVSVSIFGRSTPVELSFDQVEKLD